MFDGVLFQRLRELDTLTGLLRKAAGGAGQTALIGGPIAAGKSSLLRAFAELAADSGARVLSAVGSSAEENLPFGIVEQLIRSEGVEPCFTSRIERLMAEGAATYPAEPNGADGPGFLEKRTQIMWQLCQILLELGGDTPLVIVVDDVHFADLPSQHCLGALIRRVRTSQVMLVLTESPRLQPQHRAAFADLTRSSQCQWVPVEPLTGEYVSEVLNRCLGSDVAAAGFESISGGNPLLLNGLVHDSLAAGVTHPVAGEGFSVAVLDCLYRAEPLVLRVAQALALAGDSVPSDTLAELLHIDTALVERARRLLDGMGLLDGRGFRHPVARDSTVTVVPPDDCAAIQGELAWLLHVRGERPVKVASHLVLADRVDQGWELPTLREAAGQAIIDGSVDQAMAFLRTARLAGADERESAEVQSMFVRLLWRTRPVSLLSHVDGTLGAVRNGLLDRSRAILPIIALLRYGRFAQAGAAFREIGMIEATDGMAFLDFWTAYAFPGCYAEHRRPEQDPPAYDTARSDNSAMEAARNCAAALIGGDTGAQARAARQLLNLVRLDDITLLPITVALTILIEGDQPDVADAWCEKFLAEAVAAGAPVWEAHLSAARADLCLRRGDLQTAQELCDHALELMPARDWGVHLGGLLATMVVTATSAGRYEDAARFLADLAPADCISSRYGLAYLYARGLYHLATDHLAAAVGDFQACGDSAAALGIGLVVAPPWRIGLARASLAQGDPMRCAELAREQLRLLGDRTHHARGAAIRVLAATQPAPQRSATLREAIAELQSGGDRLELARAYADLSEVLEGQRETTRARLTKRAAEHIAEHGKAYGLLRQFRPEVPPPSDSRPGGLRSTYAGAVTKLSDAERRVAALAAAGHTNREIANRLFLTVSTVEQHLTKVYRKLGVASRRDLPPGLYQSVAAS